VRAEGNIDQELDRRDEVRYDMEKRLAESIAAEMSQSDSLLGLHYDSAAEHLESEISYKLALHVFDVEIVKAYRKVTKALQRDGVEALRKYYPGSTDASAGSV